MSNFERRGLPFRDVFDSSFDAIERVGYLSVSESREVLERRVVGLPVPFQVLCHCLSGGLPRDLIRVARALVHQDRRFTEARLNATPVEKRASTLAELCQAVVGSELEGKVSAALVAARAAGPPDDREWLLAWLREEDATIATPTALRERSARLVSWTGLARSADDVVGDALAVRAIGLELASFGYYASTVLEFFTEALDEEATEFVIGGDTPIIDRLARARQDFSLSPFLAWRGVSAFRDAAPGLGPWVA